MARPRSSLLATGLAVLMAGAYMSLGGCTSTVAADATSAIQSVAQICADPAAQQLIQTAAASPAVAASPNSAGGVLLATVKASCTVDGAVASTLTPNLNSATPAWLTNVLNGLATAASLAPYIAPLL